MFKLIHLADEHWDQEKLEKCKASAAFIEQKCFELKPDLIVIAGDLQNRRQYLAGSSAVLPMMNHIIGLADCAPVAIVYGNAEHDPPGSLDFLKSLYTRHPVYVASRAETIALHEDDYHFWFGPHGGRTGIAKAILHLFPFPTKQFFLLAGEQNLSIDESNQLIWDALRKIFTGFGVISMEVQCPVIFVGHCNVVGAELSTGQMLLGQDIMVSKHDLELARADYYALGHIHKAQEVGPRMFYSGSIYHCNFGETELKGFNFVELDPSIDTDIKSDCFISLQQIEIPSRPLSLHDAEWDAKNGWSDEGGEDWKDTELRIRVHLTKESSQLITDDQIRSNYPGAYSYQIERIVSPEERIRSTEIVKAKTLPEKVTEWGRSIEKDISPEVLSLAGEVERSVIS
jgi:exonuclease SbcD